MKDILPLGSIVEIKSNENYEGEIPRMMIIGRYLINNETGAICDYMGLVYPFGFQGVDAILYFDNEAIENVVFEGYVDEAEIIVSREIVKELNNKRNQ